MKNLQLACYAAQKASKAILTVYEGDDFEVEKKGDDSPLTKADRMAHNEIVAVLEQMDIPVLSEEGRDIPYEERKGWNQLWIVDPLDGTKEFVKRNGEFTVNIALIEDQKPVMGVVWVPVLEQVYVGVNGKGAFKLSAEMMGKLLEEKYSSDEVFMAALRTAGAQELPGEKPEVFTIVGSRSHMSEETETYMKEKESEHGEIAVISKGSSLKLCMVAEGSAHEYPRFAPTMEWDTAAGQAVCMSAGFEVVEYPSLKALVYNRQELLNGWFLVK